MLLSYVYNNNFKYTVSDNISGIYREDQSTYKILSNQYVLYMNSTYISVNNIESLFISNYSSTENLYLQNIGSVLYQIPIEGSTSSKILKYDGQFKLVDTTTSAVLNYLADDTYDQLAVSVGSLDTFIPLNIPKDAPYMQLMNVIQNENSYEVNYLPLYRIHEITLSSNISATDTYKSYTLDNLNLFNYLTYAFKDIPESDLNYSSYGFSIDEQYLQMAKRIAVINCSIENTTKSTLIIGTEEYHIQSSYGYTSFVTSQIESNGTDSWINVEPGVLNLYPYIIMDKNGVQQFMLVQVFEYILN